MQKKGNGEGSIRLRQDGRWEGRFTHQGKQKSVGGKSEKEVRDKLKKILAEIELNVYREPCKLIYSEWLDIWLWEYKHNKVKPLTFEQYERMVRIYIKPTLGHRKLEELQAYEIQAEINKLGNTRTAQLYATITKMSLEHAVRLDMIAKNTSKYIVIPKTKKSNVEPLNATQRKLLINGLSRHRLGVAFYLLLVTGMRRGELLALTWDDLEIKAKILQVNKSFNRVKKFSVSRDGEYKNEFGETKNKKNRVVPLLDETIAQLKLHLHKQKVEKMLAKIYDENKLIFCSKQGKPISPRNFTKYFYNFLKSLEIDKKNLHSLRHTFATVGLESGIDMKIMQELLGHSNILTTSEIYTHVTNDKKRHEVMKLKDSFCPLGANLGANGHFDREKSVSQIAKTLVSQ